MLYLLENLNAVVKLVKVPEITAGARVKNSAYLVNHAIVYLLLVHDT